MATMSRGFNATEYSVSKRASFSWRGSLIGLPPASVKSWYAGSGAVSTRLLSLFHEPLNLLRAHSHRGADEFAPRTVHLHSRYRRDPKLFRHRRLPIEDVDLHKSDVGVVGRHLLQVWRQRAARAAPIGIEIDHCHLAAHQMVLQFDLGVA